MKTSMRYTSRCASSLLVLLVIFFASTPARSQGEVASDSVSVIGHKSDAAALHLSLLGTIVPVAMGLGLAGAFGGGASSNEEAPVVLIGAGVILGPALGHFYAGRPVYGTITASLRAVVAVGSLWLSLSACPVEDCPPSEKTKSAVFFWAGAGLVAASAIYDIVTAPASVRKSNQAMGALGLAPYVSADGRSVGLSAYVRF